MVAVVAVVAVADDAMLPMHHRWALPALQAGASSRPLTRTPTNINRQRAANEAISVCAVHGRRQQTRQKRQGQERPNHHSRTAPPTSTTEREGGGGGDGCKWLLIDPSQVIRALEKGPRNLQGSRGIPTSFRLPNDETALSTGTSSVVVAPLYRR